MPGWLEYATISTPFALGSCWRRTKLTVAIALTAVSGSVLVYGVVASGIFNIVMGSLGLAGSAVIFVDSTKAQADLLQAMKQNQLVLADFRNTAANYASENGKLHESVDNLEQSLKKSAAQCTKLHSLQERHKQLIKELGDEVRAEKSNAAVLEKQVRSIEALEANIREENRNLRAAQEEAARHEKQLAALYAESERSDAMHKQQVEKLRLIVESSQKVLLTIATEGDKFTKFSESIDTSLIRMDQQCNSLENTADVMESLVRDLTRKTFNEFDANGDGVVTRDEFEQELLQKKDKEHQ